MNINSVDQEPFNQALPDEPLQPTEVVCTGSMPGFAGFKNKVQLSISVLMNLCLHGTHKCPNNSSSQSKAMWVDYTRKQFNMGNIVNGCMPCQIYELGSIPDYHLKMKERVLRIAGYLNDKYNLWKENEGSAAEFTDAEIYWNRVITE